MIYLEQTTDPQAIRINVAKSDGSTSGKMYKDLVTADEAKNIAQATVDEALKDIKFDTKTINGEDVKGIGNIDTLTNYCYVDPEKWRLFQISEDANRGNAWYETVLPYNDIKTVGHPDYLGGYKYLIFYLYPTDTRMFIAEANDRPFLDATERFGSEYAYSRVKQYYSDSGTTPVTDYHLYWKNDDLNITLKFMAVYDVAKIDKYGNVFGMYGLNLVDIETFRNSYRNFPTHLVYQEDKDFNSNKYFTLEGEPFVDDEILTDVGYPYTSIKYARYEVQDKEKVTQEEITISYPYYFQEVPSPITSSDLKTGYTVNTYAYSRDTINDAGDLTTPIYISKGQAFKCAHPAAGKYYSYVPYVNVNGRTDLCLDIDFHYDKKDTKDYDCRLHCTADGRLQTKTTDEMEYRNLLRTTLNVRNMFDVTQDDYDALVSAGTLDNYTVYIVDGKHLYWKGTEIGPTSGGGGTGAGVSSLNGQTGDLKLKTINGEDVIGEGNIVITGATGGVTSVNGQTGDLKLKTINGEDVIGEGNIVITGATGGVTSVNGQTGDVTLDIPTNIWTGTQAEYDAIAEKNKTTVYIIF